MSEEPSTPGPDAASPAPGDDAQAPSLEDSLRRLESAGREGLENAVGTLRALRMLVAADLALAWGALGRALAWIAVAIVFGASSWLLLMGVLIASLQRFGLSWLASMAIAAGLRSSNRENFSATESFSLPSSPSLLGTLKATPGSIAAMR